MAIQTLFLPISMEEHKRQEKSKRDKYDKHETKERKFDIRQLTEMNPRNNSILDKLNASLSKRDIERGGFSIISVTPVLGTTVEKVDEDEPVVPMVTTTGFMIMLYKED